ncbi:MAG: cytochrome P450 [Solirubrobacteraceae bacterium]
MATPTRDVEDLDDLLGDAAINRPYEFYGRLREQEPVRFNPRWNGWVVTSYEHVAAGFRDHERLSSDRFEGPFAEEWKPGGAVAEEHASLLEFLSRFFVWKDPPYHTRARGLVGRAFTARNVEKRRSRIAELVDELMLELRGRDEVDFLGEFAFHLPVVVISEYLGVPPDARQEIKRWSDDLGGVIFVRGNDDRRLARAQAAVEELAAFLRPILDDRRRSPKDDLITGMLQAETDDGERLSEEEIIANVILMVFAGHETTMNLLANSVVAFEEFPDQWERLRRDPELARSAAEEILRYDGPIRAMARWAREPVQLGGRTIETGDRVLLVQSSANRDPAAFEDPDRVDIARRPNRQLTFGQGIHTCLGGPLARLETQEALRYLAERFSRIEVLDESLRYAPTIVSRSLEALTVRFHER